MSVKALIPAALTTLRLALGPFVIWCVYHQVARIWFFPILLAGMLSDLFDGVLARRFDVSTPILRRYDSVTDVVYYAFILLATWMLAGDLLVSNLGWILVLLASELVCIGISFLRFHCYPATHSYLAKFYGLVLFLTFSFLLCAGGPVWTLPALSLVGLIANFEIIAIIAISKRAPVDVLSIFHVTSRERND